MDVDTTKDEPLSDDGWLENAYRAASASVWKAAQEVLDTEQTVLLSTYTTVTVIDRTSNLIRQTMLVSTRGFPEDRLSTVFPGSGEE